MIKLIRPACPSALSQEVKDTLTEAYKQDKEKDVWNDPKIKEPIKTALTDMSYGKCVYCECQLNIESKDVTIDHFKPKVNNEDIVVEWENLLPSCLRCNRTKNRKEDPIVDPCVVNPKEHIGINNGNMYRLKEVNNSPLGKATIKVLRLNDVDRVMNARFIVCEKLIERLIEIHTDMLSEGIKPKYIERFERLLLEAQKDMEYSAVKSTQILTNIHYGDIKNLLKDNGKWNHSLEQAEKGMEEVAFELV